MLLANAYIRLTYNLFLNAISLLVDIIEKSIADGFLSYRNVIADLLKDASYCIDYQYFAKRLYNPEKKIILFHQNDYIFFIAVR